VWKADLPDLSRCAFRYKCTVFPLESTPLHYIFFFSENLASITLCVVAAILKDTLDVTFPEYSAIG
jgi:hypothetical protein